MDADELRNSEKPPAGLSGPLLALWHLAKDDWQKAHDVVEQDTSAEAAWVHAHLHRVEGDESNAGYWYDRAGKPKSNDPHAREWADIASALIGLGPR